jgi:drug/metabolite transporter (DMT)-like permease
VKIHLSRLDALLVLMTIIWGSNYSVIKTAIAQIPPLAFNSLRLLLASALFLSAVLVTRPPGPRLSRRDWLSLVGLAMVGHFTYQLLFVEGLAHTSVANSSLIIGSTPVLVAVMTAALGHERITPAQWAGVALSAVGIYLVVTKGAPTGGASVGGDLMMVGAVLCWSATAVGSRRLLSLQSPLVVTGYAMAIGSVPYVFVAWPQLRATAWQRVSAFAWLELVGSAALALGVGYAIWYTALQRLGTTRTSIYSNVVPIVGMVVAWLWLGEAIGAVRVVGATAIVLGVALTKIHFEGEPAPEA